MYYNTTEGKLAISGIVVCGGAPVQESNGA